MSEQVSIGKLMCVRVGTHPVNLNVRVLVSMFVCKPVLVSEREIERERKQARS